MRVPDGGVHQADSGAAGSSATDSAFSALEQRELLASTGAVVIEGPKACGKGYGYRRSDGVVVVPVGVLGP